MNHSQLSFFLSSSCAKVWFKTTKCTNNCPSLATQSGLDESILFRGLSRMERHAKTCFDSWALSPPLEGFSPILVWQKLEGIPFLCGRHSRMIGCLTWKLVGSHPMWSAFVPLWSHDGNTILRFNAFESFAIAQQHWRRHSKNKYKNNKYWILSKWFNC